MDEFSIKVNRDELVKRVQENRDNHRRIFEEALVGYKTAAIAALEQCIRQLQNNKIHGFQSVTTLPVPVDHTKDYDAVLDMLSMSEDENIEIGEDDFRSYVRDEWHWKGQFTATASNYTRNV